LDDNIRYMVLKLEGGKIISFRSGWRKCPVFDGTKYKSKDRAAAVAKRLGGYVRRLILTFSNEKIDI